MPIIMPQSSTYNVLLGASAAAACCAVAAALCSQPELLSKARRWIARNAPGLRFQKASLTAPQQSLEPGEAPWPVAGFPGPARCRPLSTVTELLTWQPPAASSVAAAVPEAPAAAATAATAAGAHAAALGSASRSSPRPQLLVCHDMMGGYLEYEALLSGNSDAGEYRIWHWDCIDVFVYFSHHMVTVPPTGWVHAAHKHGVKVLGTFITEFGQGRLRCDRMFSTHEGARRVADQLAAIAAHSGFEGWLVNIENPLTPEQVSIMQHFVGYLRARTRDTCPDGLVVWYDAVTTAGKLNWQNGLTALNAPFFDLSDALFVNYTWTPEKLPATVSAAGGRRTSVYMGVDVFGRGSYGGGGFGSTIALAAAKAAGLSAALFAPGWVRENLDRSHFHRLQDTWWTQVQHSWGFCHPVVTQLPFSTSFNTGAGLATFAAGSSIGSGGARSSSGSSGSGSSSSSSSSGSSGGWYNLCETDTLPCVRDPVTQQVVTDGILGVLTAMTAYEGGSCLMLYHTSPAAASGAATGTAAVAAGAVSEGSSSAATHPEGSRYSSQVSSSSCCCPVVPHSPAAAARSTGITSSAGITSSSSSSTTVPSSSSSQHGQHGQQLALLQLFTAHVPVQHDTVVNLSCVYAAPLQDTAGPADTASCCASTPTLWLMTTAASIQAGGTCDAAAAPGAVRSLHLPDAQQPGSRSVSSVGGSSSRPVIGPVLSSTGQFTDVQVMYLPQAAAAVAAAGREGAKVQLLQRVAEQPGTDAAGSSGGDSIISSSDTLPSWLTLLPAEVGTWQWQQAAWAVPVAAGSVITGVGLAVPLSGDAVGQGHHSRSWEALALVGRMDAGFCV